MGIRYYGFALAADDVNSARADPNRFVHAAEHESIRHGWSDACLDKGWSVLQGLFGGLRWTMDGPSTRPAARLVAGDVYYTPEGTYLPHYGVLTPEEMTEIAADIELVTAADVDSYFDAERRDRRGDIRYTCDLLRQAQTFCREVVSRGQGAIYAIT
ncbi:DUF1877 family protein [Nakamurella lactea]|uniref:DUF1877 family protein n=1 Tax=Nakamurella lactea TaxID=459515 RepID=UPI0004028058|nr:DUF1877 family protein [Nakamurella lactea]